MANADGSIIIEADIALDNYKKSLATMVSAAQSAADKASHSISGSFYNQEKSAKKLSKEFSFVGSALKSLGAAAVAYAAISSLANILKSAYQEAANSARELNLLAATIESTGNVAGKTKEEYLDMASALQKSTNISAGMATNAISRLLEFTSIVPENFEDAFALSADYAERYMGGNMVGAAETLGRALEDPISGMTMLQRQGFKLTQSQKDQVKAFQSVGNSAAAQKIVLDTVRESIEGTATATADITVQLRNTMISALSDMGKEIRDRVNPELIKMNDSLSGNKELINDLGRLFGWAAAGMVNGLNRIVSAYTLVKQEHMGLLEAYTYGEEWGIKLKVKGGEDLRALADDIFKLKESLKTEEEYGDRLRSIIERLSAAGKDINNPRYQELQEILEKSEKKAASLREKIDQNTKAYEKRRNGEVKAAKEAEKAQDISNRMAERSIALTAAQEEKQSKFLKAIQDTRAELEKFGADEFEIINIDYNKQKKEADELLSLGTITAEQYNERMIGLQELFNAKSAALEKEHSDYAIMESRKAYDAKIINAENYGQNFLDNLDKFTAASKEKTSEALEAEIASLEAIENKTEETWIQIASLQQSMQDLKTGMTEKFASGEIFDDIVIDGIQQAANALSDTFTGLFETIYAGGDAWKAFGQAGVSTLANLLESLGQTLFAASSAAMVLGALKMPGYKNFDAYGKAGIGMAAGAAAMAAAASLKAIKFANGGIVPDVPGVPASGDRIFARLNPGEVVLNQKQQATALMTLANGGFSPGRSGLNVNIINNAGADVSTDYNADYGLLDVYIENKVKNTMASRSGAQIMGNQFALKRQPVRRT